MITASELRIGNMLIDNWPEQAPVVVVVKSIDEQGCVWVEDETYSWGHRKATEVEPILLTPEWLERCGFVKDEHSRNSYTRGAYAIIIGSGGVENAFCLINASILSTPKYLHQLQNLYFALAGEELTIKETV